MSRAVYHGDTVIRTQYLYGRLIASTTYVVHGDRATIVDLIGPSGVALAQRPGGPRAMPSSLALFEQRSLEMAVRSAAMRARTPGLGLPQAPRSPADVQRYALSASTNLVQHGDTVWYIHGCSEAPPMDTTMYVLFASDSLRRLLPATRSFDKFMVSAVRSDLDRAVLNRSVAAYQAPPADLPGVRKSPCDRR